MRETKRCISIKEVEIFTTLMGKFFSIMDWLTSTSDATARTGHNFYEVIVYFAMFDCFK